MDANQDPPGRGALRRDIIVVLLATLAAAVLAVYFEASEAIVAWTRPWEHVQLDEVPIVLVVLSASLAWFAGRRYGESQQELTRRRAAEARLANLLRDNRRLGQQLMQVQESERKTLARELHDELGQYLNAIKIEAITIEHGEPASPDSLRRAAAQIVGHTDHVYGVVRDLIRKLRPVALDTLGLKAALEHHVNDWRQRLPGLQINASLDGDLDDVDEPLGLAVFRLVQEGITNVSRHARAQRVDIRVSRDHSARGGDVLVSIADDGCGSDAARMESGLGLLGMRERLEMLGGKLDITAEPGRGFNIRARIPLEEYAGAAP
jgi:two-component system, NarL family, sensor histidine kinase UhpB